jgi:hypothetical protein
MNDDQPIPGICLYPPYSNELYALLEKINQEVGLKKGISTTSLYWLIQHDIVTSMIEKD